MHNKSSILKYTVLAAALAIAILPAGCGSAPEPAPPEGAILKVDNEYILQKDVDELLMYMLEALPIAGNDTATARALEAGLLPRAIARNDFPDGVRKAREKMEVAMSMLKNRVAFEDVAEQLSESKPMKVPRPIQRSMIDPLLGAAVFGKPAGYITPRPVETTFGVVIARVDLAEPEPGPLQKSVILSVIDASYDPAILDPEFRRTRCLQRMLDAKYKEIQPGAFRFLSPAIRMKVEPAR